VVLWQYRDLFFEGLLVTLQLTVLSFLFAMLVGTVMAIFRISPIAPLRAVGLIYVDIFRNVPLLSLIIVVVYALPEIGLMWSYNNSVIISMSLVGGAFICESLRAGINSVPAGQIEAARSLGLGFTGTVRYVVLLAKDKNAYGLLPNLPMERMKARPVISSERPKENLRVMLCSGIM
jgi:glutamate transport system permease protein